MRAMDTETLRREITEQVRMDFEGQVRDLRRQKNNAEEELDSVTERWRIERRKLKAEIDQLEEQLNSGRGGRRPGETGELEADWDKERERLTSEISRLEISLAQNIARLDQIRSEYELKIEDLNRQNERLRQELEGGAIVAATEVRLVSETGGSPIDAEMHRVEEAIRAIETLLEHPDTTASMMARKNTERAENEAYLRGLTFQLARH